MKMKISYLMVLAALSASTIVQAQEKKGPAPIPAPAADASSSTNRPSREEMRERFRNMTPEERAAKMKEWQQRQASSTNEVSRRGPGGEEGIRQLGIDPEEFRKMTPEQRREKMDQAINKRLAELQKKKADKTITAEETKTLERLEARKAYMERAKDPSRRDGPGGPPPHAADHKGGPPGQNKDKGPEGKGEHKDHKEHKADDHKREGKGPEKKDKK